MSCKAVFFDRDGVINVDHGYVGSIERFEFLPSVVDALASLKRLGYALVLVTNQSGIARGMYTIEDFQRVTDYMQEQLAANQAAFDKVYFCPHHPDALVEEFRCDCACRKPKPAMFFWAQSELDIDLSASIMVGDHATDILAASEAKLGRLVLVGEHLAQERELVGDVECYEDLASFVKALEKEAATK